MTDKVCVAETAEAETGIRGERKQGKVGGGGERGVSEKREEME